jgi:hypothetical protein
MRHILSREDYINPVAQLDKVSDVENMLNFLLQMLWFNIPFSDHDDSSTVLDMNWRGRQFMLEVFSKMHYCAIIKHVI